MSKKHGSKRLIIDSYERYLSLGVEWIDEKGRFSERCHRRGCTAICCFCCCSCCPIGLTGNTGRPVPYTDDAYTLIRNHPLIIASEQSQCPALVTHPYNTFLRDEWYSENYYLFCGTWWLSFLLYSAFLAIWTAFILLNKHPQYFYDKVGYNLTVDLDLCEKISRNLTAANDTEALKSAYYSELKISLYVFLISFLVGNLVVIFALFPRMFRTVDYILEIAAFVLSFVYILDWTDWQNPVVMRCPIQHQIGSTGLLLAWTAMLSYIKLITFLDIGTFVVILQLIGLKFIRFIPVLLILICGFGFTNWMLLQNQASFQTPTEALIRTGLLMFDLGYEAHLYEKTIYYQIIYVITILAAVVFCIFVLNLLISKIIGSMVFSISNMFF